MNDSAADNTMPTDAAPDDLAADVAALTDEPLDADPAGAAIEADPLAGLAPDAETANADATPAGKVKRKRAARVKAAATEPTPATEPTEQPATVEATEPATAEAPATEQPAPVKRGRGRPRKEKPDSDAAPHDGDQASFITDLSQLESKVGLLPLKRLEHLAPVGPEPDKAFMASVARFGIMEPLLLLDRGGVYELIAGRRRLKAARKVGIDPLNVVVYKAPEDAFVDVGTLMLNELRSTNAAADVLAIQNLIAAGHSWKQITDLTGLAKATIRQRMRFTELIPPLKEAFMSGKIGAGILHHLVSLPAESQATLAEALARGEPIKARDVWKLRRARSQTVAAQIPGDVFEDAGTPGNNGHADAGAVGFASKPDAATEAAIRADERRQVATEILERINAAALKGTGIEAIADMLYGWAGEPAPAA